MNGVVALLKPTKPEEEVGGVGEGEDGRPEQEREAEESRVGCHDGDGRDWASCRCRGAREGG